MTEQIQFVNKAARLDNALKKEIEGIGVNVDDIPLATQEKRGAMSGEDKTKLDSLEDNSDKISALEAEVSGLNDRVLELESKVALLAGE